MYKKLRKKQETQKKLDMHTNTAIAELLHSFVQALLSTTSNLNNTIFTLPRKEVWCIVMSMSVCLSVCITRKPRERISPDFCACCLWLWPSPPLVVLQDIMFFHFSGWRRVFIQWALWCVTCIPKRRERITAETTGARTRRSLGIRGLSSPKVANIYLRSTLPT